MKWDQQRTEADIRASAHHGKQPGHSSEGQGWDGVPGDCKSTWSVHWADRADCDLRLVRLLQLQPPGEVRALASVAFDGRPIVAICTHEGHDGRYRLRVGDVSCAQLRELPCEEPIYSVAFAHVDERLLLICGHDGRVSIWNVEDASLWAMVQTDAGYVYELFVVEGAIDTQFVTWNAQGRVSWWLLPTGDRVEALEESWPSGMSVGQLTNGQQVALLSSREDFAMWDLEGLLRVPMRVPEGLGVVRSAVLSIVDGHDVVIVVEEDASLVSFDPASGEQLGERIVAHSSSARGRLGAMWSLRAPYPRLAVMSGIVSVPTRGGVCLWDTRTSRRYPSLVGPASHAMVDTVRWGDRDLLVTATCDVGGGLAVWDLALPGVRAIGHEQPVSQIHVVDDAGVVISLDQGGTLVTRRADDGWLVVLPLATDVAETGALASWQDGHDLMAATGAGQPGRADGLLRRWNLSLGVSVGVPIRAHNEFVHCLAYAKLRDGDVLVTHGRTGLLRLWQTDDGSLLSERRTGMLSRARGFAVGEVGGDAMVALATADAPARVYALEDLERPPSDLPVPGCESVLDFAGPHVIAGGFDAKGRGPTVIRAWDAGLSVLCGVPVSFASDITAAALRTWPTVYVATLDGKVALIDLLTGDEVCPPMQLPRPASALVVVGGGDLIIGFGCEVMRVRPPLEACIRA